MTRFLAHKTKSTLIADLKAHGFEWRNEDGTTRTPEPFEQTQANGQSAIWLGKIPTTNGEVTTYSDEYCANITDPDGTYATEIEAPTTPYNLFA